MCVSDVRIHISLTTNHEYTDEIHLKPIDTCNIVQKNSRYINLQTHTKHMHLAQTPSIHHFSVIILEENDSQGNFLLIINLPGYVLFDSTPSG